VGNGADKRDRASREGDTEKGMRVRGGADKRDRACRERGGAGARLRRARPNLPNGRAERGLQVAFGFSFILNF
jgi:hypothetical protein